MIMLMMSVSVPAQTKKKSKSAKQLSKQYVDYVRNKDKGKKNLAQKGASDPATVTRQLLKSKGFTKSDSERIHQAILFADSLQQAGWIAAPKADTIVYQIAKSFVLKSRHTETDERYPKYLFGEATVQGKDYKTAKKDALKQAMNLLAGDIHTEIDSYTEDDDSTSSGGPIKTKYVIKDISIGKLVLLQNITKIIKVVDIYRESPDSNVEVLLQIAFDADTAEKEVNKIIGNSTE